MVRLISLRELSSRAMASESSRRDVARGGCSAAGDTGPLDGRAKPSGLRTTSPDLTHTRAAAGPALCKSPLTNALPAPSAEQRVAPSSRAARCFPKIFSSMGLEARSASTTGT